VATKFKKICPDEVTELRFDLEYREELARVKSRILGLLCIKTQYSYEKQLRLEAAASIRELVDRLVPQS